MSLPGTELFACAGVWRETDEFGLAYSMVMTDSTGSAAQDVHSRMPVLLSGDEQQAWVSGNAQDARGLCTAWTGELAINRTDQPWVKGAESQRNLL